MASALAEVADSTIDVSAGPELAIAATKSYTAELLAGAALSAAMTGDPADAAALSAVPELLARTLATEPEIERIARPGRRRPGDRRGAWLRVRDGA